MVDLTRRQSLIVGAGGLGATALWGHGAHAATTEAGVPVADVKPPAFAIEKGAKLSVLRPAKFVAPDETIFRENTKKFTEKTGIPVSLDFISWQQLTPQTAVTANSGAGPDIILGWYADPQVYASKLVDLADLAQYLGAKYGGWYELSSLYGSKWGSGGKQWVAIPVGGAANLCVYRESWIKEAGFDKIPNDLGQFLKLAQNLKKNGHPPGWALGHAVGDATGFCTWLMWSHNAFAIDEHDNVVIDQPATIDALNYAKELYPNLIAGTTSWNDASNNQAFLAGDISLTYNGISIYFVAKTSTDQKVHAMASDINNVLAPLGMAKKTPMSALVISAMVFQHSKFPNAAKEYIRFMMEAPQYGAWLSGCDGYWSNSLKAYSDMGFWTADPKITAGRSAMDTPYYGGYKGAMGSNSSALTANYIIVDMFAKVATGNATPKAAAAFAAKQAERYYKS